MKKVIVIICILSTIANDVYSQNFREELYLEVIDALLSERVIEFSEMEINYDNDTCLFFSRSENFINNTEKHLEFEHESCLIKVWPADYVFFYFIPTYVGIIDCQILNNEAVINLEIVIENKMYKKQNISLKKKKGNWKVIKITNN